MTDIKLFKSIIHFFSFFLLLLTAPTISGQSDTLRLLFAGDVMGHTPQISSAATGNGTYDYKPCFRFIAPMVREADLAIANLEVTLPGKGPYKGYPMFRSPDALGEALRDAGFDLLVTANNHANDGRGAGLASTIETVRQQGFWQTGTFKNQQERDVFYPLIVYKDNFKLAFLNYTYGTNGLKDEPPTIVNLIDTVQIAADLEAAKARNPHFIIAVMHWGLEYQLKENKEQRDIADFMIRHGVDLIIGSHPHVVQPVRWEEEAGRKVLVVYSMGNFISNQQQPNTDGGIIYQVELVKSKKDAKAWVNKNGYVPVWRYIHKEGAKTTFYALPPAVLDEVEKLFPQMSAAAQAKMKTFLVGLRKRIGAENEWVSTKK